MYIYAIDRQDWLSHLSDCRSVMADGDDLESDDDTLPRGFLIIIIPAPAFTLTPALDYEDWFPVASPLRWHHDLYPCQQSRAKTQINILFA